MKHESDDSDESKRLDKTRVVEKSKKRKNKAYKED